MALPTQATLRREKIRNEDTRRLLQKHMAGSLLLRCPRANVDLSQPASACA
ncbi:hypothetical protein PGB34_01745 [Xenophilus arseniciresistens]|uniref:Uncharacterized protein n=1 Tax=Xenophilus arseniciresistens TaxID=1283306 RepID=A0AAE3N654_9BURK|nr:hypothetical protein [Xenophilus arseniciresistens]MDA7415076.1 hypothetical protein [Xenophilus arseniciresistens]